MSGRFFESDDDVHGFRPTIVDEPESDRVHDGIAGSDPQGAVTVVVDADAQVLDVHLAREWRRTVDPRELHGSVVAAVQAARMQVMAVRASAAEPVTSPTADAPPPPLDRPSGREDALRLLAAARADLSDYVRKVRAAAKTVTTTHSAGSHVQVQGRTSGLTAVVIDLKWVRNARDSEVETELRDALVAFSRATSLGDLTDGPSSPAIAELRSMAADPAAALREIAVRHTTTTTDSRGNSWG